MKRNEKLEVRVSEPEKTAIARAAKREHLTASAWARSVLLKAAAAVTLALLLAPAPARALDGWTRADTTWEAAYVSVHVSDWLQTRTIATCRRRFDETGMVGRCHSEVNPILGHHPSLGAVNTYFLASGVAHFAISRALPARWRRAWQASSFGVEAIMVGRNFHAGVSFRF